MPNLSELEATAMLLPDDQRAMLAARLLSSLPAVLADDDEGIAEALRRDAELDRDPSAAMSMERFRASFES